MIKIVKALEDSDILLEEVSEKLKNDLKKKRCFTNFINVIRYSWIITNRKFIKWKRVI